MKSYDSYVHCQQLWNEKFPSHWDIIPMYAIAKEKTVCNCVDLPLLSVYLDVGVVPFASRAEKRANATSKDLSKYQRVDYGDFVLNNQQAWRGSVGVSFHTGIVSPAYVVVSLDDSLNSKYANYLLRSRVMVDQYLINSKSVGSIQRNIYWPALKRTRVIIPPIEEQVQIASFLDWKTSMVNRLINTKRQEIIMADAMKRSVIRSAVTKGLNPDAKMKYSGVKWLGDIPAHWKMIRGKNLYEKMQRSVQETDEVITCFRDGTVTLRRNRRTTGFTESLKEIGYQGIRKGDLVIHVMDAFAGAIGVSDSDGKGTPVYSVCHAKGDSNNHYYAFLLREMAKAGYIQSLYRGIRERSSDFRFEVFGAQFYPVPPRSEQDQIVEYLSDTLTRINKLSAVREKQIEQLEALKTRLISDVVTGKIDVRGIEIPDYDFVAEEADATVDLEADAENDEESETEEQED